MPKKGQPLSEEQKAKMKAGREAKKVEQPQPQETTVNQEPDLKELLARIKELEGRNYQQSSGPQVTARGLVGTVEKYSTDPNLYENPTVKLGDEPRLKQFAFDVNYELAWQVDTTSYETKDGINMKEPKFTLQLNKIRLDDNGNDIGKRIVIKKVIMFEDPQSALVIARDNGVEVDESREVEFLNDMRYLRLRDWLMDVFYPAKSASLNRQKQEVIGGKLVNVFEINSDSPQAIPFNRI